MVPFQYLFLLGTHTNVSLGCSSVLDQLYTRALSIPGSSCGDCPAEGKGFTQGDPGLAIIYTQSVV